MRNILMQRGDQASLLFCFCLLYQAHALEGTVLLDIVVACTTKNGNVFNLKRRVQSFLMSKPSSMSGKQFLCRHAKRPKYIRNVFAIQDSRRSGSTAEALAKRASEYSVESFADAGHVQARGFRPTLWKQTRLACPGWAAAAS